MKDTVTVLFNRTAKPGKEQAYEAWNKQMIGLSEQQPGHIDTSVIADDDRQYITLQRFASHQDLQNWLRSPRRLERLKELEDLTEESEEPAELTGIETWFKLPSHSSSAHIPRWKMAIVIFCVIYIFVLLLNIFVLPFLSDLPLPLRAAVFPMIMVPLMTYVVMPRVTKWLRGWLYSRM